MNPGHADGLQILKEAIPRYRAFLTSAGLPPVFVGVFRDSRMHGKACVVSIHEPRLQQPFVNFPHRPLAILSCYNEADVIEEVIEHSIAEGCCVHILDN
jgi:hypothetical protein